MKTKILLFCMALGMFFVSTTHSLATCNETDTERSIRIIPREGDYQRPTQLSFCLAPTVEQQGDRLFVHFQIPVGNVQVTITNSCGMSLFDETVDSGVYSLFTVSLKEMPKGSYVITLTYNDLELSGEFEIE